MKLSVIIPGYNNIDRWWQRCIESVIAADADEIICVNDGSTIRPSVRIEGKSTANIKWLHLKKNVGLASARNAGLAKVTSDYVTFIDSDDAIEPETIARCKAMLETTHADIAIYGVKVIWPEDRLQKIDTFENQESLGVLTPRHIFELQKKNLLNYSCNKIYRVEFLKMHGLTFNPNGMPCEDIIFNLNCIMAGAKFCTVPYAGYVYYRTRGTLLSKYKKTSAAGKHIASDLWRKYKDDTPDAHDCLGCLGEISPTQELNAEWRNIWMPGTPYSLVDRWRWLRQHTELGGVKTFFKMAAFSFLRRYFYIRPIRRWNTKRTYPYATEWK